LNAISNFVCFGTESGALTPLIWGPAWLRSTAPVAVGAHSAAATTAPVVAAANRKIGKTETSGLRKMSSPAR
jgi:hypothetical protein